MKNSHWSWLLLVLGFGSGAYAQNPGPFAPAAGQVGSRAIAHDSSLIDYWASHCRVFPGPMDYAQPSLGLASFGDSSAALGPADAQVVSLGDGGYAEFYLDPPLRDQAGPEFAVFENGFSDQFLELAFVELSSDGQNFVRFPAQCLTQDSLQLGAFDATEASEIYNLAGKYRVLFGTPFDLAELKDSAALQLDSVRYIRVIDVIGAIQQPFTRRDALGRAINDPYPTAFASGGFDLDALAILRPSYLGNAKNSLNPPFYPNPSRGWLELAAGVQSWQLYDRKGQLLQAGEAQRIALHGQRPGLYLLRWQQDGSWQQAKIQYQP